MSLNTDYEQTFEQLSTLSALLVKQSEFPSHSDEDSISKAGVHLKQLTEKLRVQVEEQFVDFYTHIKKKQQEEIKDYGEAVTFPEFLRGPAQKSPSTATTLPPIDGPNKANTLTKFGLGPINSPRSKVAPVIASPRAPPAFSARDSLRAWIHIQLEGILALTGATRGAVYIFVPGSSGSKSHHTLRSSPSALAASTGSTSSPERYRGDYLLCVGAINTSGVIPTANIPVSAGTTMGAVVHHSVAANISGTSFAQDMDHAAVSLFNARETTELQRTVDDIAENRSSRLMSDVAAAQGSIRDRYTTQLKVRNALIFPFGSPESTGSESSIGGVHQLGSSAPSGLRQALGCVLLADKPEPIQLLQQRQTGVTSTAVPSLREDQSSPSNVPVPPRTTATGPPSSGRLLQRAHAQNEAKRAQQSASRDEHWVREGNRASQNTPFAVSIANKFNKTEKENNVVVNPASRRRPYQQQQSSSDTASQPDSSSQPSLLPVPPTQASPSSPSFTPLPSPFEPLDETHLWCMTTLLQPVLQRYPSRCWVTDSPYVGTGLRDALGSDRPGAALTGSSVMPSIEPFDPNVLYLKEVLQLRLEVAAANAAAEGQEKLLMTSSVSARRRKSSSATGALADAMQDLLLDGPTAKAASATAILIKRPPRQLQKTVVLRLDQGPTTLRSKVVNASLARHNPEGGTTTKSGDNTNNTATQYDTSTTSTITTAPLTIHHPDALIASSSSTMTAVAAASRPPHSPPPPPTALPLKKGDIYHVVDRLLPVYSAGVLSDPTDALLEAAPHVTAMEALWRKSLEHITELRMDLSKYENTVRTRDRRIFDLEGEIKRMSQYFARLKADLAKIKRAVPEHLAAKFDISSEAADEDGGGDALVIIGAL